MMLRVWRACSMHECCRNGTACFRNPQHVAGTERMLREGCACCRDATRAAGTARVLQKRRT